MKPDWNDAPEWANWLAMDQDGKWYWYADKPIIHTETCAWDTQQPYRYAGGDDRDWQETLTARPVKP